MRIVVTGGRGYQDYDRVRAALLALAEDPPEIAHGGALGADSLADEVAGAYGWPVTVYRADWRLDGKAAGPIRNRRMLEEFKPDIVLAFPGGRGTASCVAIALELGITVREIKP